MKNSKSTIMKRQKNILTLMETTDFMRFQDIAKAIGVSLATIRRDILALEKKGKVAVRFGGAGLISKFRNLPDFDSASGRMEIAGVKDAIAQCAAAFLEDGDSVFMNASSTVDKIFPYIQDKKITIVTNNCRTALYDRSSSIDLILIGGEVVNNTPNGPVAKASMTGEFAVNMINKINATKCILGVSGISACGGLTSLAVQDPAVNKAMMNQCIGSVIVIADHRKIGVRHNFYFGALSDIEYLITDSKSNPEELDKIREAGVKVLVVGVDNNLRKEGTI